MLKFCTNNILKVGFILLALLLVVPSAYADKKKKKKTQEVEVVLLEPERPANEFKAMPDASQKMAKQPKISGLTSMGSENYLHGIDVSHYQHTINWSETAKDSKVGYVYLKATEGRDLIDDTYDYNLREARKQGLKVGSYHFFRPNLSAESQFQNFRKVVNKKHQDLIPLIDVEVMGGVTIATLHTRLLEFLKLVTEEYGRRPMIYTGRNFYNKYFAGVPAFKAYQFMIAQYTLDEPILAGNDDFVIWQYTGHGSVRGIRGEVDQSRFRGRHTLREILF